MGTELLDGADSLQSWLISALAALRPAWEGDMLQMPVVFRYKGYRFFFFSNEGDPLEPMHIHVRRGEATAKFRCRHRSVLRNHTA